MSTLQPVLGWIACSLSAAAGCFWAFWGVSENFHEGWYSTSVLLNLSLMLVQYLSPAIIFIALSVFSLRWPWVGGALHLAVAAYLGLFFFNRLDGAPAGICATLALLGLLYMFGRPTPIRRAYWMVAGLPILVGAGFAVEPAVRVGGRHSGTDPNEHLIKGNRGTTLVWVPRGPGWPEKGVDWHEAVRRSQYLRQDGLTLADTPQNVWRLPTVEEAVRSQVRHGRNAGGVWHKDSGQPSYRIQPDKEPPLWDSYSMIIYYWTQTERGPDQAYIVCFNGRTSPRRKRFAIGSRSFRAVREPSQTEKVSNVE